jgi:hypothetical protein
MNTFEFAFYCAENIYEEYDKTDYEEYDKTDYEEWREEDDARRFREHKKEVRNIYE